MNAFDIRLQSPVGELSALYGRADALRNLEGKLSSGQQGIVLMGPEGSGKTSLLNSFFTPEYRKKQILEKRRIITAPEIYPVGMTCTEVYSFFQDTVVHACGLLEDCGLDEDYLRLLEALGTETSHTALGSFSNLLGFLKTLGYSVSLVLDQFERFTGSSTITEDHHTMLNGLIDEKNLQFIVATNYDMTKVVVGRGSYLMQKFGNGMVRLDGLSQEDCRLLADGLLTGGPVRLGDGSVRAAWEWSGGNPALLLSMLSRCYELKQSGAAQPNWLRDVVTPVLNENQYLLSHWCRHLDEAELAAILNEVLAPDPREHMVTSVLGDALIHLRDRGLLIPIDQGGARYDFCCTLLRRYVETNQSRLAPEEYTMSPEGGIRDSLRQMLQNKDLTRVIRLISSRPAAELPVLVDELASYEHVRPVSPEEYAGLGFSPEAVIELRQKNGHMCTMLDSAIRIAHMVRLLDEDAPDGAYDYSNYISILFRPLEKQVLDCVFPLLEAWPLSHSRDVQRILASGGRPVWSLQKDQLSIAQYERFLRETASKLAKLCRSAGITAFSEARSWTVLASDIKTARLIRNGSTHPEALKKLAADYHTDVGVTRKAGRAFIRAAYIDHRLFHNLPVCLEAADYLRGKPHVLD